MKDNVVQVNLWNKNVGLLSWDDKRGYSVFATPKHLAKQLNFHGTHGRHGLSLKIILKIIVKIYHRLFFSRLGKE